MAVDSSGNINVAWEDNSSGNSDVLFARSTDGGVTFSHSKSLSTNAFAPQIGIDSSGKVDVIWNNFVFPPGTSDIFYAGSLAPTGQTPVVVIPGIMGSYLLQQSDQALIWLNPTLALVSPSDDYLGLLTLDSGGNSMINITVGSILDGSMGLPSSPTNFYGDLVSFLQNAGYSKDTTLFTFPYDWRLDNETNATRLHDFIENTVVPSSGQSQIDLVAHSMGGLLTRAYAHAFGESQLHKVIYLGTPHSGAPKSFGPLAFNDSLLAYFLQISHVNSQTLAEVSRTFPSTFQLLPRQPFIFSTHLHRDLTLDESYLQSPSGFGLLVSSAWVAAANSFHQNISGQLAAPQFQIASTGIATLNGLILLGDPSTTSTSWCGQSGNGDATVPLESATALQATTYYLNQVEHDKMANDSTTQKLVLGILQNSASIPGNVGTQPFPLGNTIEWCSGSPIRVTIIDSQSRIDGMTGDGSIQSEIPLSNFFAFPDNESGFLPADQVYGVRITAIRTGVFSLNFVEKSSAGTVERNTTFSDIPIAATTVGTLVLSPENPTPTLNLDIDGNGSVDFRLLANKPISNAEYSDILRLVVQSLDLNTGIKQSLLAKIDAAGQSIRAGQLERAKSILDALLNEINVQSAKHIGKLDALGLTIIVERLIAAL